MHPMSLSLIILLSLVLAAAAEDGGGRVKEACKAAGDAAALCEQGLRAFPESAAAGGQKLAAMSIRVAADAAVEAARWAAAASDRVGNDDNGLQECLTDCSEHMMNASEMLDDSTAAVDDGKYGDVSTFLSAAMSDCTSCNEGCEGSGDRAEKADMKKRSDGVFNLCGISMALTKQLH